MDNHQEQEWASWTMMPSQRGGEGKEVLPTPIMDPLFSLYCVCVNIKMTCNEKERGTQKTLQKEKQWTEVNIALCWGLVEASLVYSPLGTHFNRKTLWNLRKSLITTTNKSLFLAGRTTSRNALPICQLSYGPFNSLNHQHQRPLSGPTIGTTYTRLATVCPNS